MQAARLEGYIYLVGFALCIPAANWLLGHAGTVCPPRESGGQEHDTGQ